MLSEPVNNVNNAARRRDRLPSVVEHVNTVPVGEVGVSSVHRHA
jgi:hypothetical protein